MRVLGLDVGGAHVKYALVRIGKTVTLGKRHVAPFEIHRDPDSLAPLLSSIRRKAKPDFVALTMTGELSDVFPNRRSGVRWILRTVKAAMAPLRVRVVNVEGSLISVTRAARAPQVAASANWAATARWVAQTIGAALVVDIGSTTTDILPLKNGRPAVRGKTDHERLRYGELIYTGYLRTNAAHVCPVLDVDGARIEACPEHFAIVGDAHLYLGDIGAREYTAPAPDGRGKTKSAAGERLARLVLSGASQLGARRVKAIARQVVEAQTRRLVDGVRRVAGERALQRAPIILIGTGRIYEPSLRSRLPNPFPEMIAGYHASRIDPASCAAALLAHENILT